MLIKIQPELPLRTSDYSSRQMRMSAFTGVPPPPRHALPGETSYSAVECLLCARGWGCGKDRGPPAPALMGLVLWWDRHHLGQETCLWEPEPLES